MQKLEANADAFGVFGFSFLDQNSDRLRGAVIDGVAPEFENIAAGDYPVARSLYVYVKKEHVGSVPGIREFVAELTSENAWGPDGYLIDKGMIPLTDDERHTTGAAANSLTILAM